MSVFIEQSGLDQALTFEEQCALLDRALRQWERPLRRVLLLPPDITRINSGVGPLTAWLYERLKPKTDVHIMPALGTHNPMTPDELRTMFGERIPLDAFSVHDWRRGIVHLGDIEPEFIRELSEGRLDYPVRVEVSRRLFDGYDLIISLGQIVPHEVAGMANYTKNICVGAGGADIVNKSHFLGAVYGMERIMGRAENPVRRLLDTAAARYLPDLPILYVLTVMARNPQTRAMEMRGLFIGEDRCAYERGAALSRKVNLDLLDEPVDKVIVYLDPEEFKSTWLGNKAVYRTRMAIADGGELIVLAPGLRQFGEDPTIDRLIRKYGYRGTQATLDAVRANTDLQENLSAAAHLIHGSSEGRFRVTYCPGPGVSEAEIRSVGFDYAPLSKMIERYDPERLSDGWNELSVGERVYFISHPGLGLWAERSRFEGAAAAG